MEKKSWWKPFVRAMTALWILISPWVLVHLSMDPASQPQVGGGALANFLIVGVVMMVASMAPLTVSAAWEGLVHTAMGIWLIASPWVVGFHSDVGLTLNAVALGMLTLAVSVSTDKVFVRKSTNAAGKVVSGPSAGNPRSRTKKMATPQDEH